MIELLKKWNTKYDIWSFFSDFIFVFGVLILDWSPVLLILLFMIDTGVMLVFTFILFHKESKDWIKTFGFTIIALVVISFLFAFYRVLQGIIENLKLDTITDPSQVINSYILPVVITSSVLNHYAEFDKDLDRMKEGTYNSTFIKHFFLRYILITILIVIIILSYMYINSAIVITLIFIKSIFRLLNKRYRDII